MPPPRNFFVRDSFLCTRAPPPTVTPCHDHLIQDQEVQDCYNHHPLHLYKVTLTDT